MKRKGSRDVRGFEVVASKEGLRFVTHFLWPTAV